MQGQLITAWLALSALAAATPVGVTPTTTSPSCVTLLASPTPSDLICGLKGSLKTPSRIARFSAGGDPNACRTNCLADKKCISFSYNAQAGFCQTFSKPIIGMGWTPDSKSQKEFYNRNCFFYTPKGCNLPPTPTPTPSPSAVPLQHVGYWLQIVQPSYYLNRWYLSAAWTDTNYNALSMTPSSRQSIDGSIFDLNNGVLSLIPSTGGNTLYPLWQADGPCDSASLLYYFSSPKDAADVTPTCASTLTADGIRGDLTCSTSACGTETWSYYYSIKLGPVDSPNSVDGLTIAYAYPQITSSFQAFLLQISSSDATVNGKFVAQDATGTLVLVKDYSAAFQFALYSGYLQSTDTKTFFTGAFSDPVGVISFGSNPNGAAASTGNLVHCNPVGTPPIMECRVQGQITSNTVYSGFYQYETEFSFCTNDAQYGTSLTMGPASESLCSPVRLAVVQAPVTVVAQ